MPNVNIGNKEELTSSVRLWPADLRSQVQDLLEAFIIVNWDSIAHSLSLSSLHCPDMTEIMLKRMQNTKSHSVIYPFGQKEEDKSQSREHLPIKYSTE